MRGGKGEGGGRRAGFFWLRGRVVVFLSLLEQKVSLVPFFPSPGRERLERTSLSSFLIPQSTRDRSVNPFNNILTCSTLANAASLISCADGPVCCCELAVPDVVPERAGAENRVEAVIE